MKCVLKTNDKAKKPQIENCFPKTKKLTFVYLNDVFSILEKIIFEYHKTDLKVEWKSCGEKRLFLKKKRNLLFLKKKKKLQFRFQKLE